ncbi:hypothetical protein EOS_34685 [Caballeronia mineralivorans PML1(12)]|uniref:Uncharacterized protein n=1 Tax=Caballeronia mineralivorans PML1(12) TaxID=908627 RepID=A0A0J1CMC4_9BURK|nr:hypothetical protein EOS_34685 [Caballeronia mineralivorans PML1(12)]
MDARLSIAITMMSVVRLIGRRGYTREEIMGAFSTRLRDMHSLGSSLLYRQCHIRFMRVFRSDQIVESSHQEHMKGISRSL